MASSADIIAKHWSFLSDRQWHWEFLRRSVRFREDCAVFIDSMGRNKTFLAVWDLPHPGDHSIHWYCYLKDFRTLLTGILTSWLENGKDPSKVERDLFRFAAALNSDGEFHN